MRGRWTPAPSARLPQMPNLIPVPTVCVHCHRTVGVWTHRIASRNPSAWRCLCGAINTTHPTFPTADELRATLMRLHAHPGETS